MDALLKFLCEKLWPLMVDRWGRRSTVLALEISMILTLLVWLTNGAIDTVSLAQGGFIVTAAVLLWLVWYGTVRIPKCKRGRIGIALAVCAEDEEQDRLLKSDFIDEFKEIMPLLGFAYLRVEKVGWLSFSFKSLNQKGNEYVNQPSVPYARNLRVSL